MYVEHWLRKEDMMDNVYYNGELIPEKDWDYETSRPKDKEPKAKPVVSEPVVAPKPFSLDN